MLGLADRHIAHRVEDTEQVNLTVTFQNEPPKAIAVSILSAHLISIPAERLHRLASIADHLQSALEAEIGQRQQHLLARINATPGVGEQMKATFEAQSVTEA